MAKSKSILRYIFIGAGDLSREIERVARKEAEKAKTGIEIVFYVEEQHKINKDTEYPRTVLTDLNGLIGKYPPEMWQAVVCVGHTGLRARFYQVFKLKGYAFGNVISTETTLESDKIGEGSIVFPGTRLAVGAELKSNVMVNFNTVIGHDTVIGSHSVLSPGVNMGGRILGGERVLYGLGCSVLEGKTIGNGVVIAAGSSVWTDVPEEITVVGAPAMHRLTGRK